MGDTNMNEVIKSIISIDNEAKKRVEEAEEKSKNIDELVEKELDSRKIKIDTEFQYQEKQKMEEQEKEIDKIRENKQTEVKNKTQKIEKEYNENEARIITEIVTRITKI